MNAMLPSARLIARLNNFSRFCALTAIVIGCLVIVGWLLNVPVLKSVYPSFTTMKFNTAIGIILAGSSLLVLNTRARIAALLALVIIVLALLTLLEYQANLDLGIDQLFVHDASEVLYPGRMSVITAVNFLVVGSALIIYALTRFHGLAHIITLICTFLSSIAVIGYLFNTESLYRVASFTATALHTAYAFLILSLGVLVSHPTEWPISYVSSNSAGGYIARRLFPVIILVSVILGWLVWQGTTRGMFDATFGFALFTVCNAAITTIYMMWIIPRLHAVDVDRMKAVADLAQANEQLEERVRQRTNELSQANLLLAEQIEQRTAAENQFRAMLESAPDAVIVVDQQGAIVLVNSQTESLFGYSRQELTSKPIESLIPEPFRSRHVAHRHDYLQTPKVRQMGLGLELAALRKNSSSFPVEISLSPVDTPSGMLIISAIRDVTDRQQQEMAIRESERQFRLLAQNSPDTIFVMDVVQKRTTYANRSQFLGYSQAEIEQSGFLLNFVHPEDRERVLAHWRAAVMNRREGGVSTIDYQVRDKAGDWQWIQSRETTFAAAADGTPTQVLITLSVITARKQAERQALELQAERERTRMLTNFITDASHEFRTPLTTLNTSVYLLAKSTNPEKHDRHLANAEQQITRINRLLDRLLTIVRLDNHPELNLKPLDINRLASDLLGRVFFDAKEKDIVVTKQLLESSTSINGDFGELSLALNELGRNAVWYTPAQGRITIRTLRQDDHAVLEIADTGIGIPTAELPYLFEPFFRVDKSRSSGTGGAGLGLYIARRIIELHQGTISVESSEGSGSTFRLSLPILNNHQPPS
ncbi:MAG: PAS domain S-box protein [Anaerolineae bacterium]|nr:PAS domain S-box protein [Anaerolineae bacterium]